ncbi:MAG: hypothetical protein IKH48_05565 [Prevotella sp.]|nr:hypothetical protein [Prevotella sp.]
MCEIVRRVHDGLHAAAIGFEGFRAAHERIFKESLAQFAPLGKSMDAQECQAGIGCQRLFSHFQGSCVVVVQEF